MNIDFHVHGLLSKKSKFDKELFLQAIENAKENGLDAFILCEHFNAKDIYSIQNYLKENHKYEYDRYIVNNFSVFLGMEIDVKNGGHVILCGNRDNIERIRKELDEYTIKPNFIEFENLLDMGEKYECLMVGSHPYRETHKLYLQPKNLLARLHALDLNSTDIYGRDLKTVEKEVKSLSEEINVPYITGSDSHYPIQLGSVKTIFNKDVYTIRELKELIREKQYKIEVSKSLRLKVFSAKITKEYIKRDLS
ncbi:PHP-associated domain-containing protein [Clostridioides difficile]